MYLENIDKGARKPPDMSPEADAEVNVNNFKRNVGAGELFDGWQDKSDLWKLKNDVPKIGRCSLLISF